MTTRLTTRNAKSDVETIDWPYWYPHYVDPSYYKITKDGTSTSLKMVTRCIEIPHFNIVFICAWSIFASFVIASTVFDWSNYNIVNLVVMILSQPCPMKLSDLIVCPTLNYLWFVITKRPHSPPDCRCSNLVMEANWK